MVRFKYSKGALSGKNKNMYIPLVCIQKEGLGQSWDREQGCYLRRAVYSLFFASIRHARFQIGLRWNPKGTKPVFMFIEQTREAHHRQARGLLDRNLEYQGALAHSSFFQSTSTMLSTPLVSSFTRTRLCCCCMACRNLDNCWKQKRIDSLWICKVCTTDSLWIFWPFYSWISSCQASSHLG